MGSVEYISTFFRPFPTHSAQKLLLARDTTMYDRLKVATWLELGWSNVMNIVVWSPACNHCIVMKVSVQWRLLRAGSQFGCTQ